jgi:uncharacterized membrane protein
LKIKKYDLFFQVKKAITTVSKMDARIMNFENSVFIDRPVGKVFKFVTDFSNNARWQTDILEMEITSGKQFGPGSTYRCVNRFMGQRIETEGLITRYEPDRRCSLRITSGPVIGTSSLCFEALNGGTRFTTAGELDLTYFRLAKLLVKRKIKKQLITDMDRLKAILENGAGL